MTYLTMRIRARDAELRSEHRELHRALVKHRWSPKRTASYLGISPSTLYRALDRHEDLRTELEQKAPPPGRIRAVRN